MGADYRYGHDGDDGTDDGPAGPAPRGYGPPAAGGRSYGQAPPPAPPPLGETRGYFDTPDAGGPPVPPVVPTRMPGNAPGGAPNSGRSYGSSPAQGDPVDPFAPRSPGGRGRGPAQPDRAAPRPDYTAPDYTAPDYGEGTRRIPTVGDEFDPDVSGGYRTGLPSPRRSRLEERQAARQAQAGTEAASQERSTRYERSPLDGRSTRNGASRPGPDGTGPTRGPGDKKRKVKKTGYHRYFDYPRTGKAGWRHWTPSIKQVSSFILGGIFLLIGLVAFEYYTVQIPTDPPLAQASTYQYADGTTQFASTGTTSRIEVNLDQVPLVMQQAIVSAENKTFWSDPGVSYTGTARALIDDLEGGSDLQGGSTLTQQYVKNTYLNDSKNYSRKIDEIFISLKISHTKSKQWILQQYLNTVFFGRDAYGIEAASKAWLGEDITKVNDPAGAALLASLVNEPTYFSSGFQGTGSDASAATALETRWKYVLGQMVANNNITQAQANAAVFPTPIPFGTSSTVTTQQENTNQQMAAAANSWLNNWATVNKATDPNVPTSEEIGAGGYTVVTTFNQQDMANAQQAVQNEFTSKLTNPTTDWNNQNLYPGLAAVDPKTGDLVAFYGGTTAYNNATQRQVQPGSTFKAFTLATAYSQGYSENSYMDGTDPWPKQGDPNDVNILKDPNSYKTVTNDGLSGPSLSFNVATADSVNTAFVRLEQQVGPSAVLGMVNKFGIVNGQTAEGLDQSSGLTLGISSVDPARMADAYSTFPNNGSQYPLIEVLEVKRPDGSTWKPTIQPVQVVTPTVAQTVTNTLWNVTHLSGATACCSYSTCATTQSGLNNIAGKTGTSTMDYSGITGDSANLSATDLKYLKEDQNHGFDTAATWFNGYTSNLEVAVDLSRWVPDSTGRAVQFPVDNVNGQGAQFGAQYPLSIWAAFLKSMHADPVLGGDPAFTLPSPDPSASILNSPSGTPSAPPSATGTPTPTLSPSGTPTTCSTSWFNPPGYQPCPTGGRTRGPTPPPTGSGSPSPSTSPTGRHGKSPPPTP